MTATWDNIRQAIPELHDLPEAEPPRIDTGQNAIVWDAAPFIVRTPRHAAEHATPSFHREAAILKIVRPHLPIPVPAMTVHDLPDGAPIAVHRALPGQPLMEISEAHDDAIAHALGDFLATLHAAPLPLFDGLAIPVANRGHWRAWLRESRQQLSPYLDADALQRLTDAGNAFLDEIVTVSPVLIHGDFGGSNILAEGGAITGIIDFAGVQIGDPASDIAGLVASYGDPFLDRLEPSYPGATTMRNRIAFYQLAFAAMEAIHGLDHGDDEALRAGIASLEHGIQKA